MWLFTKITYIYMSIGSLCRLPFVFFQKVSGVEPAERP